MRILGIETATDVGSVAIVEDETLRGEIRINQKFSQSKYLIQSIDFLLQSLTISLHDIDGIAVSIGPGSYTGLRIGLSVAKGLAYSQEKPLVAVNSLDSLAQLGRGFDGLLCPLIRFRKNEYFHAFYSWDIAGMQRQSEYQIAKLPQIIEDIDGKMVFLGIINQADLKIISESGAGRISYFSELYASAYWVAVLGQESLKRGFVEDIRHLSPFYMHDFPLQT